MKITHKLHGEKFGERNVYKVYSEEISTTGKDSSNSNSKEKEARSFGLRVGHTTDCQQDEGKRSYRRYVNVVMGIIVIALLLVLFGKVSVLILVFVLRVIVFHVIIYVAML